MGNPNAVNLEESATPTPPAAEPAKGEVTCSDPHCRCHDNPGPGHCGDCGVLPTIKVDLGLALSDHTWVERKVEFEIDPEFEKDKSFDLTETSFNHWLGQNEDEANKLAPSGWFLIAWEWKS
jgi:hypothetical protein